MTGTSIVEGINNKIKILKRKANGLRDFDYFALLIKAAFTGKDALPRIFNRAFLFASEMTYKDN